MYLSRLTFSPCPASYRLLSSEYEIHRTVMSGFKDGNRDVHKVLFYIKEDCILVQSESKPDWTNKSIFSETKQFDINFEPFEQHDFSLVANPVVCKKEKLEAIIEENKLVEWIVRKSVDHGFKLKSLFVKKPEKINFVDKRSITQTHNKVEFSGTLEIKDKNKFENTIKNGIGKGKAFGFGMLMVK